MGLDVKGILAYGYAFEPESEELERACQAIAKAQGLLEPEEDGTYDVCIWDIMDEAKGVGLAVYGHSEYPGYIITPSVDGDEIYWKNRAIVGADYWSSKPMIFSTLPTFTVEELQPLLNFLEMGGIEKPSTKLAWHLTAYCSI